VLLGGSSPEPAATAARAPPAAPEPEQPKPEDITKVLDEMVDKFISSLSTVQGLAPAARDAVLAALEPLYEPALSKVDKDLNRLSSALEHYKREMARERETAAASMIAMEERSRFQLNEVRNQLSRARKANMKLEMQQKQWLNANEDEGDEVPDESTRDSFEDDDDDGTKLEKKALRLSLDLDAATRQLKIIQKELQMSQLSLSSQDDRQKELKTKVVLAQNDVETLRQSNSLLSTGTRVLYKEITELKGSLEKTLSEKDKLKQARRV
jgi:chromosome segregation ATPase